MVLSVSAVVLLGLLVLGLWWYRQLDLITAVVCGLFGFYLSETGAAPAIRTAAGWLGRLLADWNP